MGQCQSSTENVDNTKMSRNGFIAAVIISVCLLIGLILLLTVGLKKKKNDSDTNSSSCNIEEVFEMVNVYTPNDHDLHYDSETSVVYYHSPSCPWCQKMKPEITEFCKSKGFKLVMSDVSVPQNLQYMSKKHGNQGIPLCVFNGQIIQIGYAPAAEITTDPVTP